MEKFITGLKYGTWQTRLYVIAIPVALFAGLGVVITAFVTNIIWLFLVGVVLLIGGAALILNYNIDEGYITDPDAKNHVQNPLPADNVDNGDTSNSRIKHGDVVVGSVMAEGTDISDAKTAEQGKVEDASNPNEKMKEKKQKKQKDNSPEKSLSEEIEEEDSSKTEKESKKRKKKEKKTKENDNTKIKEKKPLFWAGLFAGISKKEEDKEDSADDQAEEGEITEPDMPSVIPPEASEPIQGKNEKPEPDTQPKDAVKEDVSENDEVPSEQDDKEDELMEYNEVVMKQVFYKYKVKRDHMTVMIDVWEEKAIKQAPAYIWVTKGQLHVLTISKDVNQYTIPLSKAGLLYYKKGVICQAKEEYKQFRKESMLATVFSPYLPTYHEGNKNHRPVIYKNLFALENGMTVTNTSAKALISMLNPRLEVDDIVTRDVRFNDYFKEIYKLGLLFREQIYSVKEYQGKVSDVLRRYVTSGVGQDEYENTLQSLYQHKLITEEYIMYYMQYYERIQMENLGQAGNKKNRKKKKA